MPENVQIRPTRRSAWRAPATFAMLGQVFSLCLLALIYKILAANPAWLPSLFSLVFLQGCLSALFSACAKLDPWWIPIQFFFPLCLWLVWRTDLPPTIFLIAFLFSLVLYWSTFRTQVPYYPSGQEVWDQVAHLVQENDARHVLDVGSGLGGLLLHLGSRFPDKQFTGIELAPLPWLISRLRASLSRREVRFIRADYENADFASYEIVFAYLAPPAMPSLWLKAKREMRPGCLLLSYEFEVPGQTPDMTILIKARHVNLYGWRF